jgi:hypothetical protein
MTVTSDTWNHGLLDTRRTQGDPHADAVVREIFAYGQVSSVNTLMRLLFRNDTALPEDLPAPVRSYFEAAAAQAAQPGVGQP